MAINWIGYFWTWQHEIDDPHRARFSTAELKEILNERDDLRLQIGDLEQELKVYKPVDEPSAEEKYVATAELQRCVCCVCVCAFFLLYIP